MQITKIDGSKSEINIISEATKEHFANPYNYTKEILAQFDEGIYKGFISPADKIFLDIGANIGLYSLHISPYAERIVCVEPTPEHAEKLREILQGLPFELEEAALSDYQGETPFHWCGINTTMNSLQERGDRSFIVNCLTLKDICDKYKLTKVDFCKIDIEGSEWKAITPETVKPVFDIIDKIFIELHPPTTESQDGFIAIFEDSGYIVERSNNDALFCHK